MITPIWACPAQVGVRHSDGTGGTGGTRARARHAFTCIPGLHMSKRFPAPAIAAGVLMVLAACGGSDATAPAAASGLHVDEAAGLAVEMGMALSGAGSAAAGTGSTASAPAGGMAASVASVPFSHSVSMTVPCPKGGSTKLTGSATGDYDATSQKIVMDVTATQEPQGCAVLVKQVTFTTNGAPNLSSSAHMEIAGSTPTGSFTSSTKGGFSWTSSDGRSGNCAVDYTSTADFAAKTVKVTGSFCGTALDYSGSFAK